MSTGNIDWTNVNLEENYERSLNLLENYTFDTLILEISCNLRREKFTEEEIKQLATDMIRAKYREAMELLEDNLTNITNQVKKEYDEN
tara:strand:+ start:829 stop:1092 length:264 start_codon:yes stop_codon:yes gene_type:complete